MLLMLIDDARVPAHKLLLFINTKLLVQVSEKKIDQPLYAQVLSRLGHMSYDVVGAQILQTGIPTSKANLIGTTEVSVASLAESVMLGVAIIANDASHFGFLAMLSLLSVVGAAWMFCRLLVNPTDEQRSLFAVESNT
jgi:hypothetical protein